MLQATIKQLQEQKKIVDEAKTRAAKDAGNIQTAVAHVDDTLSHRSENKRTIENVLVVFFIIGVDFLVLWLLRKVKPLTPETALPRTDKTSFFKGTFSAKFKGVAGTITVGAAGVLGSFLTVFVVIIGAVLLLDKFG